MGIPEVGKLEKTRLRDIWPNEARHFTPWLANNLSRLSESVGMELQYDSQEHTLSDGGRVDIFAKTIEGEVVIIENQLGPSDDDHFLRLFGYAANSSARLIIWVASDFSRHIDRLNWLVDKGVELFAIKLSGWHIGDAKAVKFEMVAGPTDAGDPPEAGGDKQPSVYARFYRPLTAALRTEGIRAMGGRQGGWTGRYRKYRFGVVPENSGITLYSVMGMSGRSCEVGLVLTGENQMRIYDKLYGDRDELGKEMGQFDIDWQPDEVASYVRTRGDSIADHEENSLKDGRNWMKDTLMTFQAVFQPRIEEINSS